ncbi:MAG: hypothetical protein GWN84_20560 [Gammaproteobacteria bacterium]|nr:hypothetical protein [Gammaproteobacteria bacterium]NIR85154.1 hypothetical protein [Gammaproteobacteria bacterium]NIU06203.1 hypothetical protein [Gammaproteobacteria bacterium]NIX87476.1 hypothetical protein [Gammaproteobacteria bacterium]
MDKNAEAQPAPPARASRPPEGWTNNQIWLGFAGLVALGVAVHVGWWHWHVTQWGEHYNNAGSFGDAFAPAAGLLSTIALAAAVLSVLMQRSELKAQREELRQTRNVLALQHHAQAEQAKAQQTLTCAIREASHIMNQAKNVATSQHAVDLERFSRDKELELRRQARELLSMEVAIAQAQVSVTSLPTYGLAERDHPVQSLHKKLETLELTVNELQKELTDEND